MFPPKVMRNKCILLRFTFLLFGTWILDYQSKEDGQNETEVVRLYTWWLRQDGREQTLDLCGGLGSVMGEC